MGDFRLWVAILVPAAGYLVGFGMFYQRVSDLVEKVMEEKLKNEKREERLRTVETNLAALTGPGARH